MSDMKIGGLTRFTAIDYPGKLAATIFCQGCPLDCIYCHNAELKNAKSEGLYEIDKVIEMLKHRTQFLDGVVFSGGEPTMQDDLAEQACAVKEAGLKVCVQTSGYYPDRLMQLLKTIDMIAIDIKALPEDYPRITRRSGVAQRAYKSLELVLESGVEYVVRTTWHPTYMAGEKREKLIELLNRKGVVNHEWQYARI